MSISKIADRAFSVLGLTHSQYDALVKSGRGESVAELLVLAEKMPVHVPHIKAKVLAMIPAEQAPSAPTGPTKQAPTSPVADKTVYWFCLNGIAQVTQATMSDLQALGASHWFHEVEQVWRDASNATKPKEVSGPFSKLSVKKDDKGKVWLNGLANRFGGINTELLTADLVKHVADLVKLLG